MAESGNDLKNNTVITAAEGVLLDDEKQPALFADFSVSPDSLYFESVETSPVSVTPETEGTVSVSVQIKGTPTDPLFGDQWHLNPDSDWDINIGNTWDDYTGAGVIVGVIDNGFDYNHVDLAANYRTDLDYDVSQDIADALYTDTTESHGTAVMGLIGADDNGVGTVGVAFDADLVGYRMDFGSLPLSVMIDALDRAAADVDVLNNSWSFTNIFADNFENAAWDGFSGALTNLAENGRDGLGTVVVNSAGNYRHLGHDANYHNFTNSPYTIAVGAMRITGEVPSFSNSGANLLVTAPGASLDTLDITGAEGANTTDYNTAFGGTSASAPVVSGIVALMLEANEDLGYRDVQEILAYTTIQNDPDDASWSYNWAGNWNGGGLHFSHDYGFGLVDAHAAVRLAETWDVQQTYANIETATAGEVVTRNIEDQNMLITTLDVADDIEIEHVLLHVDLTHSKIGDLVITLVSPDGTESVMMDKPEKGDHIGSGGLDFTFSSVAHWGEDSAGMWTLRIEDSIAGNDGTLNAWDLEFIGNAKTNNDTYIFTSAFGDFSAAELVLRSVINENDGGIDTINLSTLSTNSTVDLETGTGTVAGQTITINTDAGDHIEKIYGGDGNDNFTGDDADNELWGGRGDDTLEGKDGDDILDGGSGNDTAIFDALVNNFTYKFISAVEVVMTNIGGILGSDTLLNIENFQFNDGLFTFADLETMFASPHETITGTAGADSLGGRDGNDTYYAGAGNDRIVDFYQDNAVYGEEGDDNIITGSGDDLIYGDGDGSELYAGGNDTVSSGYGNDTVYGGGGDDFIHGGGGDDILYGGDGNDTLRGGHGLDTLYGGDGNDKLAPNAGGGTAYGGNGNDILTGGNDVDNLYGEADNDRLNGRGGDDVLDGGAGDDWLRGGDGADSLTGGAGADDFVWLYDSYVLGNLDTVEDFSTVEGDRLDLRGILSLYDPLSDAISDFVQITDDGTDSMLSIDIDGGGDSFTAIATIVGVTGLTDESALEFSGNLIA